MEQPVIVNNCESKKELMHDDALMVKISISYPQFECKNKKPLSSINRHYKKIANSCLRYAKRDLLPTAVTAYNFSKENGFPFSPNEMAIGYKITLNNGKFLSLYHDHYLFTGGAHGNTTRCGDTWCVSDEFPLTLKHFFIGTKKYKRLLIDNAKHIATLQIADGTHTYFENYPALIAKYFNPRSFFLTASGIVTFYGQYEIAPYVEGIPEFLYKCGLT